MNSSCEAGVFPSEKCALSDFPVSNTNLSGRRTKKEKKKVKNHQRSCVPLSKKVFHLLTNERLTRESKPISQVSLASKTVACPVSRFREKNSLAWNNFSLFLPFRQIFSGEYSRTREIGRVRQDYMLKMVTLPKRNIKVN